MRPAARGRQTTRQAGLALLALGLLAAAGNLGAVEIELPSLAGVYENIADSIQPVRQGPITILVSSPEHRLEVREARLDLEWAEADAGIVHARLRVFAEGSGKLEATVVGPAGQTFVDDVILPRQWLRAEALVRLERLPNGWTLHIVEPLQPDIVALVDSRVANDLLATCRTLQAVPLVGAAIDCDTLRTALATARIPMPTAGQRFVLDAGLVSPAERAALDRWAVEARTVSSDRTTVPAHRVDSPATQAIPFSR